MDAPAHGFREQYERLVPRRRTHGLHCLRDDGHVDGTLAHLPSLDKRAERIRKLLGSDLKQFSAESQIWWGVSVEDRRYGLPRVELLRETPAVTRFLSVEPLLEDLGPLDLTGNTLGHSWGRERPWGAKNAGLLGRTNPGTV
jgi:protein gp37